MEKKTREFKITIKDLPEEMTKGDTEKVKKSLLSSLNLSRLEIKKRPIAAGDCDCWSYTACACKCA